MPWVGTKGSDIVKADLDLLATEATRVLTNVNMGRTYDTQAASAPATMTGFSFSTPTETYPDPIGSPVVKTAYRWAWCDELNHIWMCLWNIPATKYYIGGDPYPFGYGSWDLFVDGTPDTNGVAWDRIAAYWSTPNAHGTTSLDMIVCSPGPNLHTRIKDARPDDTLGGYAKVYDSAIALYSRDQGDFTIYAGLFTSLVVENYDPGIAYVFGTPNKAVFTYAGIPAGSGIYGYFEVEYTWVGAGSPTDPSASSDCYIVTVPPGVAGTANKLWQADKFYMWLSDGVVDRGEDSIISTAGAGFPHTTTGTDEFNHYVASADWEFTGMQFRGGIYTDSVDSSSGVVTGENVIHPRNYSVKAALKISATPYLVDDPGGPLGTDYLLFDDLEQKLSVPGTGTRICDTTLRAMFRQDTKDALDDYPVPTASDVTARAELLTDLNSLIAGDLDPQLYDLWIAAVEATVTLRPGTRWMLERDSNVPAFLERMRRLILEDCYPTELRRIPPGYNTPEDEILQLSVDIGVTGIANFEGTTLYAGSYFCSNQDIEIVYIGFGLPQWCRNTYLDYQMPDGSVGNSSYNTSRTAGPRGYSYQWTSDQRAWFRPALSSIPSNYPVMHRDWFGVVVEGVNSAERPNLKTSGFAPYWAHDEYHSWNVQPESPPLAAGGLSYSTYNISIQEGAIADGVEYEYTLDNPDLEVYVSWVDYPDPTDPSTYEFKGETGYFRFPSDFPNSIGTDDGFHSLFVTVKNPTSTSQTFREIISVFQPDGTETGSEPPNPCPRFFPVQEPSNVPANQLPVGYGDSYRFGPEEGEVLYAEADPLSAFTSTQQRPYPCPQRGQHIRELLIRRLPVRNSRGIYVEPDAADMEEKKVKIGLMCGAGVVAGAVYGSYPGNWMDFETHVIPAGEVELRVEVSYIVLKGCPLAYYVTTSADAEDDEEFEIFASVEFQPAVNNTFIHRDARVVNGQAYITGEFSGPPWASNTYLYQENLNAQLWGGTTASPRHGVVTIVQPPVSNREVKALYDFLLTQ